ncbi:MAG: orotidine-5'-phosphate decarboxylase [Candidatus Promineifilaceae bacterium]|jgi:orotidine-5'-phosphate decarboxylase
MYLEKLKNAQEKNNSWVCIGLDPQLEKLPIQATHQWDEPLLPFSKAIIDATADIACAYKPNMGFYLQWGAAGIIALERTIQYIPKGIPIIVDCKAGDIGHTQMAWAKGIFDTWNADAFTMNPYVGRDAIEPIVKQWPDKGVYVLGRTSNPSAPDFQGDMSNPADLSRQVIDKVNDLNRPEYGTVGLVIGATWPEEMEIAREQAPDAPFLIPGIGSQGGSLEVSVKYGADSVAGPLISASRSIIYAGNGYDFADKARAAAIELRDKINILRGA